MIAYRNVESGFHWASQVLTLLFFVLTGAMQGDNWKYKEMAEVEAIPYMYSG